MQSEFGIGSFDGWTIEIFKKLQLQTGFTCGTFSELKVENTNGASYNDLLQHITNCSLDPAFDCKCDIGVGSWWQSINRTGVDFLTSHGSESISVLTTKDNLFSSNQLMFLFNAFEPLVWVLIILLCLCFIGLKLLDNRFSVVIPTTFQHTNATMMPSKWQRLKRYMLKNSALHRLRKSTESTGMFFINTILTHDPTRPMQ